MILKEFPDLNWLKQKIKENFDSKIGWNNTKLENSGWPNVILNVKSTQAERTGVKGPFSLFLNNSGSSRVGVESKTVTLNENAYILTNNQEYYDLIIDNPIVTETFNIHFGTKFCFDAFNLLKNKGITLLDNPNGIEELSQVPFRSVFRDQNFNSLVKKVHFSYQENQNFMKRDEALFELFQYIYIQNCNEKFRVESLSSSKPSTKEELLKRLYVGLDFIHATYHKDINLEEIAAICYLSKFHFLRTFKEAFQTSPYQYIKQLRIKKAIELIKETSLPINEISYQVGINNGSSLSRMIYKSTGLYPTAFRMK